MLGRFSKLILVGVAIWGASHVSAQTQAEKAVLERMSKELIPELLEGNALDENAIAFKMDDIFTEVFKSRENIRSLFVSAGLSQELNAVLFSAKSMTASEKAYFLDSELRKLIEHKEGILIKEYNKIRGYALEYYSTYALRESGIAYSKKLAEAGEETQGAIDSAFKRLACRYHSSRSRGILLST